jgi:hypothetical protein
MHTATIFPGQTMTLEIYADPKYRGAWMFHCHNLYHMANVMMMYLKYNTMEQKILPDLHHVGAHHSGDAQKQSWWDNVIKVDNQYFTVGGGAEVDHLGETSTDIQLKYRGNVKGDKGFINAFLSATKNYNGDRALTISTGVTYCDRIKNLDCISFNLQFINTRESQTITALAGKTYKPFNSDIVTIEAGAGPQFEIDKENHSTKVIPYMLLNGMVSVPVGWNIHVDTGVGCQGKLCTTLLAQFIAELRASRNITISLNCSASTDKDLTGCFARFGFESSPIRMGAASH